MAAIAVKAKSRVVSAEEFAKEEALTKECTYLRSAQREVTVSGEAIPGHSPSFTGVCMNVDALHCTCMLLRARHSSGA